MESLTLESKTSSLNQSFEHTKVGINVLIETIKTNKNFSKLIIYSLNTLKSYLIIQNQSQAIDNAVNMIESKIYNKY